MVRAIWDLGSESVAKWSRVLSATSCEILGMTVSLISTQAIVPPLRFSNFPFKEHVVGGMGEGWALVLSNGGLGTHWPAKQRMSCA